MKWYDDDHASFPLLVSFVLLRFFPMRTSCAKRTHFTMR